MKRLVAYFSATGVTRKRAQKLAELAGADLFEIKPEVLYTKADLDWTDKNSRSTIEMNNKDIRPALEKADCKIGDYDVIYLGFPIWWHVAPTLINTFLETYDFSGKKIVLFATSGSEGFGKTLSELIPSAENADIIEGRILNGILDEKDYFEVISK